MVDSDINILWALHETLILSHGVSGAFQRLYQCPSRNNKYYVPEMSSNYITSEVFYLFNYTNHTPPITYL